MRLIGCKHFGWLDRCLQVLKKCGERWPTPDALLGKVKEEVRKLATRYGQANKWIPSGWRPGKRGRRSPPKGAGFTAAQLLSSDSEGEEEAAAVRGQPQTNPWDLPRNEAGDLIGEGQTSAGQIAAHNIADFIM